MKLDARRIPAFLRDPGSVRCVLLHGDDAGLIRERADAVSRAVVPQLDDPFRVAWLDRDGQARLPEEAAALALTGGRRVVRVREVGDGLFAPLKAALDGPGEALIVLEAPELPSRSKLRQMLEKATDAATIGCYPDEGRALDAVIRAGLAERGVSVDADALAFLVRHLGADRALTAGEVAKLALYVGDGGRADLDAAQACVGDAAALSTDDALFAATAGDAPGTDRALALAIAEGGAPVGLLRQAQSHLQRLHRARLAMEAGQGAEDAARSARPPVFFRRVDLFVRALRLWTAPALLEAIGTLVEAERGCKRTGAPDETLCREAIAALARRAGAANRP